ncbi:hypothetical protein [Flavobacterium agrisoli]|uniref:Uncharacterized protein n=1 Tax=Flavobacterium agrisoli TaxID=2793066 RepID=A0A934PNF6_9FLAO|nr:hypothetical protein [Flavobacterium agrisoli]MBK0370085.1 hypothetical protein [Flavobacterium agrisoli]
MVKERVHRINKQKIRIPLKFYWIKLLRTTKLFFKKDRALVQLEINYYKKWHFDNAYFFLELNFKNAIWYKIDNTKSYHFAKPIILNLEDTPYHQIEIEVFGYSQKETITINLDKVGSINSSLFKTEFKDLSFIELIPPELSVKQKKIKVVHKQPSCNLTDITIKRASININFEPFKNQDFL